MNSFVKNTEFLGQEAVLAGNDALEITLIPGWGSQVISMVYKDDLGHRTQLLRVPESARAYEEFPILYGDPILFPPNRIEDGQFTFRGRAYQFHISDEVLHNHQHGFVYGLPWQLVRSEVQGDTVILETQFDAQLHQDVMDQFPHAFSIKMRYILEGSRLTKVATVTNHSDAAFPWGLGFHTTFRLPFVDSGSLSRCVFQLDADRLWELTDRMLPTGRLVDFAFQAEMAAGMSLVDICLDHPFLAKSGSANRVVLTDPDAGVRVEYACDDEFTQWVVYNGDGKQGFVCPEPYTWITNAPNVDLPAALTGLQVLNPQESVEMRSAFQVSSIRPLEVEAI